MTAISVSHLKKHFNIYRKTAGILATIKSIFVRKNEVVKAVDDISFEINQGELVGFIGPNGAGKTTTLKCLSGLLYPTKGKISVLGYTPYDRKYNFLKKISLVMGQKNQLWWDLPANETFRLNKEIYEMKNCDYQNNLDELSTLLEVKDLIDIPVRRLSLGQRMKMELIAALLHRPNVLFLDEPTIGLDVVMQKKMRDFIAYYNKQYKSTIILTSHYMVDVKQLCKRVIIIDKGKILYDGDLEQLVKKYADKKIISVVFEKNIDEKKLSSLGQIKSYKFPKLVLNVERSKSKYIAGQLLEKFPIEDFTIEDPEVDDVIRQVFKEANK